MALSNSYDFSTTRDTLITDALLYIGALGEGETPTSSSVTEAARMLNMLMKAWAADGMPVWALDRGYVLPITDVSSIATTSHVVTDYTTTTLSADEAASQTVLSVTSSAGMTALDQVGIELDDGTMHWTTIVSVDSSVQITITSALASVASSGNRLFSYTASTDRVARPIRVVHADLLNVTDATSNEIDIVDRQTYFNLPSRTEEGSINVLYHDPELSAGQIYFWPRFQSGDDVIEFTFQRPFMDFDSASDNPDCPQEFYLALTLGLASLLGPKYGIDLKERQMLMVEAKLYRDEALSTIYAEGSIYIQPEHRGN